MKYRSVSLFAVSIAVLGVLLSACRAAGGAVSGDPLNGTSWELASIDGAAPISGVTISAAFKDGQISGSSGCNSYGGKYTLDGSKIQISEVVSTLMACTDQGVMDQESAFLSGISNAQSFEASAAKLQITTSDGRTLVFAPSK